MSASSSGEGALRWDATHPHALHLSVEGALSAPAAAHLVAQAATLDLPDTLWLDLSELEVDDGVAVAELINLVRALAARVTLLTLHDAPQMLAHTLYKVGMLEEGHIRLSQPRQEEGSGAG